MQAAISRRSAGDGSGAVNDAFMRSASFRSVHRFFDAVQPSDESAPARHLAVYAAPRLHLRILAPDVDA
jgi:hypothetical protein